MGQSQNHQTHVESFLEEHRELMQHLSRVQQWCHESTEADTNRFEIFSTQLEDLRETLMEHFQEEEDGGYLSPALEVAPRFSRDAQELLQQHQEFLNRLDSLVNQLKSDQQGADVWSGVQAEFDEFLVNLRKHEGAENAIVQSAFGDDVGTGD